MEIIAIIVFVLAVIPALMSLWNLPQLRPPGAAARGSSLDVAQPDGARAPVSVLIPARNESANIRGALTAVLANKGIEFEVIVLDDHSEDDTARIVRDFIACDSRVRLEHAPALPTGWCGKQHACHVLARLARHPLLVFVDADVRLAPDALVRMSDFMGRTSGAGSVQVAAKHEQVVELGLASGVPRQWTHSLLEKLLIPLIHFILLGFLPLWRMRRCAKPAYGAGCGQLFIARADAYWRAGGHAAIRESLHDGLKLPRAFRQAGIRTDLFDATDVASCRMYQSSREVLSGLAKNAHEGLATPVQIVPWTLLLFGGQVLPWILLPFVFPVGGPAAGLVLAAALLALLTRLWLARSFKQSLLGAWCHPLSVCLFLGVQWYALARSLAGRPPRWKGRSYGAPTVTHRTPLGSSARGGFPTRHRTREVHG